MQDDLSYKEVWYFWDGKKLVFGASCVIYDSAGMETENTGKEEPLGTMRDDERISHYTLGEKRRRIECPDCKDSRFAGMVYCGGYFEYRDCQTCKRTGKVWEYEK